MINLGATMVLELECWAPFAGKTHRSWLEREKIIVKLQTSSFPPTHPLFLQFCSSFLLFDSDYSRSTPNLFS